MDAGREMDALVAKKVMDRKVRWSHGLYGSMPYFVGEYGDACLLPSYSTDIAAAWQVVEKLRADGWYVDLTIPAQSDPTAMAYRDDGRVPPACHLCMGETIPEAICRAALLAVGA